MKKLLIISGILVAVFIFLLVETPMIEANRKETIAKVIGSREITVNKAVVSSNLWREGKVKKTSSSIERSILLLIDQKTYWIKDLDEKTYKAAKGKDEVKVKYTQDLFGAIYVKKIIL